MPDSENASEDKMEYIEANFVNMTIQKTAVILVERMLP